MMYIYNVPVLNSVQVHNILNNLHQEYQQSMIKVLYLQRCVSLRIISLRLKYKTITCDINAHTKL